MKKTLRLLFAFLALIPHFSSAQKRICGSNDKHLELMQSNTEYAQNRASIESQTANYLLNPSKQRAVKTIPVVFHIVYNTASQNVSDAQIQSQLTVLNNDYRKLNADWTSTPTVFQGLVADCEVQFCLAQQDPNGNATTGINRVSTSVVSFSTNDAVKYAAQGGANAWDRNKYLNIWVCKLSGGVLGYAQFPGGPAATDGVVITYTGFGTMGSALAPFNKGRTATHEVGHWLNLYHIWGDDGTGCNGSDLVNDTPNQGGENYGCPSFPHTSCSNGANGDMFMNYMDYTDDACMYMFSPGQKARMDALFIAGGARAPLLTSSGCNAPTPPATCGTPTGLNVTGITTSTATLNWGAVAGATSYTVQYKLTSSATWNTITASINSASLSGLSAATSYDFQVRATCAVGNSSFSSTTSFTTANVVTPPPATCTNSYESNNTKNTATTIATNTTISSMIGTSADKDYYKITTTSASPKLKVTLSNLPMDYDVKLYASNGTTLLGTSALGGTSTETIKYNAATTGKTYYIYVYGYGGAYSTANCYTLNASTSNVNWKLEEELASDNKAEINLYPNPTNTKISVDYFAEANTQIVFNVYNSLGQKVISNVETSSQDGANSSTFDMSQMANGMYIIEMHDGEERKIQKFTVQK